MSQFQDANQLQTQLSDQAVQHRQQIQPTSQPEDEIDHYANDSPLPKSKPMDLKALWLKDTDQLIEKFNIKFEELKKQQRGIEQGFRIFAENENKYKLSSLRKIDVRLDKKLLYTQYMLKTRKTIEKISPILIVNIFSYVEPNLFLILFRMRKISKIFNQIYLNESIQLYLAQKDYLYSGDPQKAIKASAIFCKKYLKFYQTFRYYKDIQYTQQIPQNSIMKDFEEAVSFINQIHKLVLEKQSRSFTYYQLMNTFMKKHRVVIGLSSLSLTSLVMVRKAAIIGFSNYLAFNRQQRTKQQITKTKYSKVISVVEYEDYRESLIINTKVSNYLWQNYGKNFAVLVTNNIGKQPQSIIVDYWDILIYHLHDEGKAILLEKIQLKNNKFISTRFDVQFYNQMKQCHFSYIEYTNWVKQKANGKCIDIITSPCKNQEQDKEVFSYCFFYRFEQYYVIAIPNISI